MKKTKLLMLTLLATLTATAQNPYLPLWEHLPDGEPRVFEDPDQPGKLRAYIVGSHDTHYNKYCGNDVRLWSAPVEDLSQWRDEGPIFSWFTGGQWDTMYAPDLVETTNRATGKKTYWLYPHSRGWGRIGTVCKGDRPNGPFVPVNLNAEGTRCVDGSLIDFDPSVFIEPVNNPKDPDYATGYRAYVFYGFQHSTACELDPNTMYSLRPGTELHDYFIPASARYGVVRDPEGTQYPALYKGQNPGDFNFFEASSIRQIGDKYVMVFSGYSGPDYGLSSTNSALRYAYGDSPLGPWRSGGVLVDSRGVVPNADGSHLTTTNAGHNTHGSLQQINGQWYVFYHRPPRGFGNARQAMVAPVKIEWDKKSVAKGGQVRIVAYDPYAKNQEWTAKASDGTEYTGAEVTSEGFQIFGLPPYAYYSAGIACYMAGPGSNEYMQDNHDVWNNSMDLKDLRDGSIIGFKYFGFGGLDKDTKGVKAFPGISSRSTAKFNAHLTTNSGKGKFKIHVMLDGPYASAPWSGREIAVIEDACTDKPVTRTVGVPFDESVFSLKGKHAVYLVVEADPEARFTLHGICFGEKNEVPSVPQVSITVNGKVLSIPAEPVRATNQNGLMDTRTYQLYAPFKANSAKIEAKATGNGIKQGDVVFEFSPIVEGRSTVKATYKGQTKIFLIN